MHTALRTISPVISDSPRWQWRAAKCTKELARILLEMYCMALLATVMNEKDGLRYHGGALLYAVLAYGCGFAGLLQDSWAINLLATLLLAHAMIVASYLVHECVHNTIFRKHRHNARLGAALTWLCGASYGRFEDLRYKHFRHHVDNDDVVWFDYESFFARYPALTRFVRLCEFFYIPAHELLMHAVMAGSAFLIPERRAQRRRNLAVLVVRGGAYLLLLVFLPKVALLYAVAYLIMLQVLRFMDMLQHDYPYSLTLFSRSQSPHRGDRAWEQEHTFSNPLSLRFEKLNWLVLNFGFHNAHHADMQAPWYRLPALHRQLAGDDPARVIPLSAQWRLFHRNRLLRVYNPQVIDYPRGEKYLATARSGSGPIGGNAASFLTAF